MERLDDVLGYDLKIYQNSSYFSFSLDSIILANYANIRLRDKNIVDFCTGNGVIPLIISNRTKNNIVGVEIQEKLAELATKSVNYNKLDDRKKYFVDKKMPKFIYILPANFSDDYVFNDKSHTTRKEIIEYFKKNYNNDEFIILDNMTLFPDGIHLDYKGHENVSNIVLETIKNG